MVVKFFVENEDGLKSDITVSAETYADCLKSVQFEMDKIEEEDDLEIWLLDREVLEQ